MKAGQFEEGILISSILETLLVCSIFTLVLLNAPCYVYFDHVGIKLISNAYLSTLPFRDLANWITQSKAFDLSMLFWLLSQYSNLQHYQNGISLSRSHTHLLFGRYLSSQNLIFLSCYYHFFLNKVLCN